MLSNAKTLDIIIPVYNEEECLPELFKRIADLKNKIPADLRVIFVNDGSKDGSMELLSKFADSYDFVSIINFSRNFGHQIAITAGIDYSTADYVAVIDADLQDPPDLIVDMLKKSETGFDVVYGKRRLRKGDTMFKRWTAVMFYRLISKMCEVEIPLDTGDFRLMSRRAVDQLKNMRERHRFVRGMVPWIGFASAAILYDRDMRYAGETKYPLRKMIRLSKDAIFSFSNAPLKMASFIGITIVGIGSVGALFMLYIKFKTNLAVPGITSTLIAIVIMGGIQIIMLGVVGEYIGRIFEEVKGRPLYIVAETKNIIRLAKRSCHSEAEHIN